MNAMFLKMCLKLQDLTNREEGQDLVEYALVVALVAIVAAATLKPLGTAIAAQFTAITAQI
jgi:pilus assembly protein Flp/PilA